MISEKIESLVDDFKQILTEARDECHLEEVTRFADQSTSDIDTFMKQNNQKDLRSAFCSAEKCVLETTKQKLMAEKQKINSEFSLAYG